VVIKSSSLFGCSVRTDSSVHLSVCGIAFIFLPLYVDLYVAYVMLYKIVSTLNKLKSL